MFSTRTAFIIGAGASKEFNLPIGSELKTIISQICDIKFKNLREQVSGSELMMAAIRNIVQESGNVNGQINLYLKKSGQLSEAMSLAISIDNYLEAHSHDEIIVKCGKLSICNSIIDAERRSTLYCLDHGREKIDFRKSETAWLAVFMQAATEGVPLSQISGIFKKVSIISFNYDRCIEHYIYHALISYYGIDGEIAAEIVNGMDIVHPYGSVGPLHWQGSDEGIDFGKEFDAYYDSKSFVAISDRINTFNESLTAGIISKVREKVSNSERLVFLGFAFHKQNVELLRPVLYKSRCREIFATSLGLSGVDQRIVARDLAPFFTKEIGGLAPEFYSGPCVDFFKHYWRSLLS